ncbi:hypothetical protein DWG18_00500 [Lysobacter sp. TY2-98]|uniref:hypothetical protein n=1 Tax=Lysobacter sp. TY2-98 TaxID=2290922 RepID=UPI000E209355|nr:hypothetical protein [Lysobacter sp. TY2-98]AXK70915.1 hypothetical protein DWG18_00500 [Lysobacter sp. TY2-98]
MSLPWSAQQIEWLQAMGLDVLQRPAAPVTRVAVSSSSTGDLPAALVRAARGADLASLIAQHGVPRDGASRRVFWRALRSARKAASRP